MAQVDAYHAEGARVYHFFDTCTVGSRIPLAQQIAGKGDKGPCRECSGMSMADLHGPGMHP